MTRPAWRDEWANLKRLARYAARYRSRLTLAIVSTLFVSVLSVVSITMLQPIIEPILDPTGASNQADKPGRLDFVLAPVYVLIDGFIHYFEAYAQNYQLVTLAVVCACFLFLTALTGTLKYLQEYMVYWIGSRVILDLQRDLYNHMTHFNAAYFSQNRVGALISYFSVDIRAVGIAIFKVFGQLLLDPCLLFMTILALLYLQWQLTLLYALIFPVIIYSVRFFSRKNRKAGKESQEQMAGMGAFLQEHFSQIRLVQVYGMQEHQQNRFWNETLAVFRSTMSMLKAIAASSPISQLIGVFAFCCVLLLGGYYVIDQQSLDAPEFFVFLALLGFIYQPTKRIERSWQELQIGLAAAERVFAVLDTDAALPMAEKPLKVESFNKQIEFRDLSFTYDGERPVLDSLSFTARKGEQIAIVGPSGAGKTTLVNLIPRFYDPTEGSIQIDGIDLRQVDLPAYRRLISVVPQDVAIFGDSVWANITCGDTSYTREQVIEAAKAAYAHEFISDLPQGYDTVIGERGTLLSGGQCQRVAIARAFLRNAPILILDEATSSLDSESERHIKNSLQRLMQGRTSFVIAHRLSTILEADRILVLEQGRLVDSGRHNELLKRCSLYQRLYHLQFSEGEAAGLRT